MSPSSVLKMKALCSSEILVEDHNKYLRKFHTETTSPTFCSCLLHGKQNLCIQVFLFMKTHVYLSNGLQTPNVD